jgi:hypothetical protein
MSDRIECFDCPEFEKRTCDHHCLGLKEPTLKGSDVTTSALARQYFEECGLEYSKIHVLKLDRLVEYINRELHKFNKESHDFHMDLNKNSCREHNEDWTLKEAYFYVSGKAYINGKWLPHFLMREAISFNSDGFIGFAGWASTVNTQPFLKAFVDWCDYLRGEKTF